MPSILGLLAVGVEYSGAPQPAEGFFYFLFLFLVLIASALYLSYRASLSNDPRSDKEFRLNASIAKLDLMLEQNITICGRLKFSGRRTPADPAPHFILEDATKNQIPIAPWLPLEAPFATPNRPSEGMWDYLGKQLIIAGKVGMNERKEKAVIPQLVVEVLS